MEPEELFTQWNKVFLYVCALCDTVWTKESISKVYDDFRSFMKENICEIIQAPTLLEREIFLRVLLKNIAKMRSFLKGKDEVVLSKEVLHLMNSRYVHLPYIYDLVKEAKPLSAHKFCVQRLQRLIADADTQSAFEKGKRWEAVAEYFLQSVPGLKITGKRVRAGHQEIDLSVANQSLSDFLWQLGAYILVECKNYRKNVGIETIRGIAYISQMKGNKTAFLFTSSSVTKDARREIVRLAIEGMYVLVFTKKDLLHLQSAEDCMHLLRRRWRGLQVVREENYAI